VAEDLDAKYSLYKKTVFESRKRGGERDEEPRKAVYGMYGIEIYLTCGDLMLLSVVRRDIIKLTQRQKSAES